MVQMLDAMAYSDLVFHVLSQTRLWSRVNIPSTQFNVRDLAAEIYYGVINRVVQAERQREVVNHPLPHRLSNIDLLGQLYPNSEIDIPREIRKEFDKFQCSRFSHHGTADRTLESRKVTKVMTILM